MKVTFINSPTDLYPLEAEGKRHYETIPPLGLGYVASSASEILGRENVALIDGEHLGLHPKRIVELAAYQQPDVIGINAISPTYHLTHQIIKLSNELLPQTRIVVGGTHSILNPDNILLDSTIKVAFACTGWGEESIKAYLSGVKLEEISGIAFKRDSEIIKTETIGLTKEKLETYRLDRTLFENDPNTSDSKTESYVLASRGCPFDCDFCAAGELSQQKSIIRSIPNIIAEIDELRSNLGVNYIRFVDDLFLISEKRAKEFCKFIDARGLNNENFGWEANGRANILAKWPSETWALMRNHGLKELEIGIESGSPAILGKMNKRISPEQVELTVEMAIKNGIGVKGFIMVGYPTETREDVRATLRLSKKIKAIGGEQVRLSPVIVKPYFGTKLWDDNQDLLRGIELGENGHFSNLSLDRETDSDGVKNLFSKRTRYNSVMHRESGKPFVMSEFTNGISADEAIDALRELIIISGRETLEDNEIVNNELTAEKFRRKETC